MKRLASLLFSCLMATAVMPPQGVLAGDQEQLDQIKQSLDQVNKTLTEMKSEFQAKEDSTDGPSKEQIRKLVKQSFELETQLHLARVTKAEAELKRVKESLAARMSNADAIIDERFQLLTGVEPTSTDDDDDTTAAVLSSEGWMAWRKQDYRNALKSFRAALAKEPENGAAMNGLGWTYIHLGEFDKSIETFEKLLKMVPNHGAAQNGIGQCLLAQKKYDEAEKFLLKGTEDTIKEYGEAVTVKNGITASWITLVRLYLTTEDYEKADQWARKYLKHKPDDDLMKTLAEEAGEGMHR